MKFTNKFTFITSAIVLTCISLVLVGGLVSLRSLTLKYHQQRIDSIIKVIDKQIEKQTTETEFDHWLPDLLDASGIVRLQVKRDDVTVYQNYFESREYYPMRLLLRYSYDLENYPGVKLILYTRQPFSDIQFTFWPLAGISTAILFCLCLLYFSLRWIKRSFHGAELLERRAHYLLQNNPTARFAQPGEWPKTASKALDILSERLESSRKERSIFDTHIRSKAFLDQDTGLGNRIAFENRLDAVAMNENFSSNALIMISLTELSTLKYQFGEEESEKIIQQVVMLLKNFCIYCDDAFHGRVEKSKFVILLPQMNYEETKNSAKKITKSLFQMQLPNATMIDAFFHVGVVNFPFGAKTTHIIEDLNRALLVAEYQKTSGWHLSEENLEHASLNKGTVKWRALFVDVLEKKQLLFYQQPIIQRDGISTAYTELWPRILGYNKEIIAAGTFMPMAEKCGLNEKMDKLMLEKVLALLIAESKPAHPIAVNLGVQLLTNKKYHKWLMFELMEQSREVRNNLVIEVSEHLINKNYHSLRTVLIGLQKIGCKIAIDNVGKTVVNTQYILDFNIDYLKLHPSLVRDLHLRKMNQIAIQSLMASCLHSHAQVIAVGVEQKEEWKSLLQLGVFGAQGSFFISPQVM